MYSVDALLSPQPALDSAPWALRLMQILIATVYIRSLGWKLRGRWWRDGTAVYWALSAGSYRRHDVPAALRRPWVYAAGTYGTLVIEGALGALIWISELRYAVLAGGAIFHLTLEYFLRIRLFQWTMLVGLLLFLKPADLVSWLAKW
jgi:Vitamin K-dependent gamma-carboxylase